VCSEICDDSSLSQVLYSTLQTASGGGGASFSQELSLCAICALNNTSFYINYTQLDQGTLDTARYLFQTLPSQEAEVRSESVKVLGNLTRNEDVRLMSADYMEDILMSLDGAEETPELICATCGVLINVVIEELVKAEFLKGRGVERVVSVLGRTEDMMVSLISCQVLWNLLISHENQGLGDISDCISPEQRAPLKVSLMEKVDRAGTKGTKGECDIHSQMDCNCDSNSNLQLITQDFLQVAKDLVAKL